LIYCLGVKECYERYFQEQEQPLKLGRREEENYPGGSVWRTREEAQQNCPPRYAVYGVIADWEKDTTPSSQGNWHDLLIDAPLVRLDQDSGVSV
jgi:hypothetical protein